MYYNDKTIIFLDGRWPLATDSKTNLFSQTLHYGIGVFEGIRAYHTEDGTHIFKAKEHFERLHWSATMMHIEIPYSVDELIALSYSLLEKNNLTNAYLRPLVFMDANMSLQTAKESHTMLTAWSWGKLLGDQQLRLMTSSFQRPNPKSCFVEAKVVGHYTNSILASTEAKNKGYDDALLLDMNGFVAEGPGANFFYEKDGILYTSPLGNILNGITRQTIFELAQKHQIQIVEKHFSEREIYQSDGAFFTGTAAEVSGIESLDDHVFKLPWQETLGFKLSELYQKEIHNKH